MVEEVVVIIPIVVLLVAILIAVLSPFKNRRGKRKRRLSNPLDALESILDSEDFGKRGRGRFRGRYR